MFNILSVLQIIQPSQLFCITANNTSNNDTACSTIENILYRKQVYSFSSDTQCLPCLAHVVNLAITDFMSVVTHISSIETTSAIWEFDPSLPGNHILGDSLDIVSAIQTLAIKIQASGNALHTLSTCRLNAASQSLLLSLSIAMSTGALWMECLDMLIASINQSTFSSTLPMNSLAPSQPFDTLD